MHQLGSLGPAPIAPRGLMGPRGPKSPRSPELLKAVETRVALLGTPTRVYGSLRGNIDPDSRGFQNLCKEFYKFTIRKPLWLPLGVFIDF